MTLGALFTTGTLQLGSTTARGQGPPRRDEELGSLGYLGVVEVADGGGDERGVVRFDPQRAEPGLNLYTPTGWGRDTRTLAPGLEPSREAHLVDERGRVLRSWSAPDVLGGDARLGWEIARLDADLNLVALHAHAGIAKLDWDGNVVWKLPGNFHHDFVIRDDGSIVALVERKHRIDHRGEAVEILDSGIAFVSTDGELESVSWMLDSLAREPFFQAYLDARMARARGDGAKDWLHANTIDILKAHEGGAWQSGDFVTCLCVANMIVVFAADTNAVRWHWDGAGELQHPHDPSQLANGNLLVFDNGKVREWSRVIEVDPTTQLIAWSYRGSKTDPFFSVKRGLAQRLPGGNTLVSSTQEGRAFEITAEGEIVWEFYNPQIVDGYRVSMRLLRLDAEQSAGVRERLAR